MADADGLAPAPERALTPENFRELLKRPLRALPPGVRPAALVAWSVHQHLFPSALPIAGAVSVWIGQHGLRPDDAVAILRGLAAPERMGSFRFAADLMTALAAEAAAVIHRRQVETDMLRRREEAAAERATPEQVRAVRDAIGGIGTGV